MVNRKVKKIILTSFADFFNGMSTAWVFAAYDAVFHSAWIDLISSLTLGILCFSAAISIKVKLAYDKLT